MEKVAEFINAKSFRHALARLCRLAGSSTSDGRRILDDWENQYKEGDMMLMDAIDRIESIDNRESLITSEEVETDPLLWLQALDNFCVRINPKSYGYLRNPRIDDGEGQVWMLPIYQQAESCGGGKRRQFGNLAYWLKHCRVVPQNNPQGILVNVAGIPRGYHDWLAGRFSARTIRIAVVHFDDGVRTNLSDSDKKPSNFICKDISDTETCLASALHHISEAKKRNAHILVMPELTITPDIRSRIVSELQQLHRKNGEKHSLSRFLSLFSGVSMSKSKKGGEIMRRLCLGWTVNSCLDATNANRLPLKIEGRVSNVLRMILPAYLHHLG